MARFPTRTPAQWMQEAQWLCTETSPSAHWTVTRVGRRVPEKGQVLHGTVIMDCPWDMRMSIPVGIHGEFGPFPRHHGVMRAAILKGMEMVVTRLQTPGQEKGHVTIIYIVLSPIIYTRIARL